MSRHVIHVSDKGVLATGALLERGSSGAVVAELVKKVLALTDFDNGAVYMGLVFLMEEMTLQLGEADRRAAREALALIVLGPNSDLWLGKR